MDLFDTSLSILNEDITIDLRGQYPVARVDFFLNPRHLRGSDFLMRWSQGVWSEERIIQAVNETNKYFALPYGPSSIAPQDIRERDLYFERLEQAGLGKQKRPDLLIFRNSNKTSINEIINKLGGIQELPFISEDNPDMQQILSKAIIAVECETSLWKAQNMPDYGLQLTRQRRLKGQFGLKKNAVIPTVILKEEDRLPLRTWQEQRGIKIHIWQVFFDIAIGLVFDTAEDLITTGKIQAKIQTFHAPNGATTRKTIYFLYYHYAYPIGSAKEEPTLIPDYIEERNGYILPYVRFKGGSLIISPEALQVLDNISNKDIE
ncbi:MAG: AccI family restriction endonuclease [Ignavibacteriales bacterium]